jgi:hypothetical protein
MSVIEAVVGERLRYFLAPLWDALFADRAFVEAWNPDGLWEAAP